MPAPPRRFFPALAGNSPEDSSRRWREERIFEAALVPPSPGRRRRASGLSGPAQRTRTRAGSGRSGCAGPNRCAGRRRWARPARRAAAATASLKFHSVRVRVTTERPRPCELPVRPLPRTTRPAAAPSGRPAGAYRLQALGGGRRRRVLGAASPGRAWGRRREGGEEARPTPNGPA